MRVGISITISGGRQHSMQEILELAMAADRLGYDTLWHCDHVVVPIGYQSEHPRVGDRPGPAAVLGPTTRLVDPHVVLAAVATVTSHLRIGTAVTIGPLYHPLMLARSALTLSVLSDNRFALGLGAGWLDEEFDALQSPFNNRGKRLDEIVAIVRASLEGGVLTHDGPHYPFGPVQVTPEPVGLELVIGGNSPPALRRAAHLGDAWFTSGSPTFEASMRLRDQVIAERRTAGLDRPFRCYIRTEHLDEADVARYRREGVSDLVVMAHHLWPSASNPDERIRCITEAADLLGLTPPAALTDHDTRPGRAPLTPATQPMETR